MSCTIEWNSMSPQQWDECLGHIPYSTLLQSYDYARAYCPGQRQKGRWGLIRFNDQPAGIVQVFEAGILWNALHAVIIDRGPIWFKGCGGAAHTKMFFEEFNRQFPARLGRRRRILPEVEDGMSAQKILQSAGLMRREERPGYQTVWVDLSPPAEELRKNLRPNWRNSLSKAERSGVQVTWHEDGTHFSRLVGIYAADKALRGYEGPSPSLLRALGGVMIPAGRMMIGCAQVPGAPDDDIAAMILLVRHGRSATYLVGWTSESGRDLAATHLLLWQGMGILKDKGVGELDLGGVNDDSAKGIKDFKEGLGGRTVRYAGHYY